MEYGEDSCDETHESSEILDEDDGRSYKQVDCPKEITVSNYDMVNTFIATITNYYWNKAYSIDLLESLNCTMNSPEKLEYLIHRIYAEASKWAYDPYFSRRFAKICKHCCSMTWVSVSGSRRNKTFEEVLVDRISDDFGCNAEAESNLRRRISYVLKGYKGPDHKKAYWISLRMKDYASYYQKGPANMEFIHALFLEWILVSADLLSWIEKLLVSPNNKSLKILCNVLDKMGEDLDFRHNRVGSDNKLVADTRLDPYFSKMQNIALTEGSDILKDVKDRLQDIVDLRIRRWY